MSVLSDDEKAQLRAILAKLSAVEAAEALGKLRAAVAAPDEIVFADPWIPEGVPVQTSSSFISEDEVAFRVTVLRKINETIRAVRDLVDAGLR